jgi:uncharacterized protein
MARLVLFALIGFVIWLLLRSVLRGKKDETGAAADPAARGKGEDMVRCTRCGVNLPRSESKEEGGRLVCADNPQCGKHAA